MKKIVVVDDEKRIREIIVMYLIKEGYEVADFDNATDADKYISNNKVDLIVLDIMMRGMDGLELCKKIRKVSEVPIIFVSARNEELDRILGLELGADDYLSKPFSVRELVVRIKNILRRSEASPVQKDEGYYVKDVFVNIDQRIVKVNDSILSFTSKEFDLLAFLTMNKGYPLSRDKIIENVWGYEYDGYDRNVDDTIKRLRKKLKEADSKLEIQTVWGFGYRVSEDE